MTAVNEKELVCCVEEEEGDRISQLPEHLIDSILERLPFEDAVKTSIISKNWRYKWTAMTELVFDKQFSKKIAEKGEFDHNEFIRIINQVLNLHNGSILKFHLHIPKMVLDRLQEVDKWMLLLSRNGVRELLIRINSNEDYEVSSHVFPCLTLTKLTLHNCFVKLPLMFEGFPNLEYLHLQYIDFGDNLGGTEINLPQLKVLTLHYCIYVHNINIKATKMNNLIVFACPDAMLLRLSDSPSIYQLHISFEEPIEGLVRAKRIKLARMLNKFPRVKFLSFDCEFLKFGIEEKIPKWLPLAYSSLKHLHLHCIQLGDLCQLHGILCLLRNSPNLESLLMIFSACKYPPVDVESASNHLEAPNCLEYTLNQLQTVEIRSSEGSRPELLFIKLLLAHSPSLDEFTIRPSSASNVQKRLDIAMWFPRASPKAKVIYLNPL